MKEVGQPMISYWIIVSIIASFFIIFILTKFNLIFKNNSFGSFIRSKLFILLFKKIIYYFVTLFLLITCIFLLIKLLPKDYFYSYNNSNSITNSKNLYNKNTFIEQLFSFYYNILPFPKKVCSATYLNEGVMSCSTYEYKIINFGFSYTYMQNTSVWTIIKDKCSISFLIGFISYVIQCLIGYPLGILLAKKENKFIDKFTNGTYITITSIPTILYFYICVLIFALFFKLPVSFEVDNYLSYIAPITAVSITSSLIIAYWVRKYILIEANKDYVKLALGKGLSYNRIFYKHIVRNALIPMIRTIPTSLVACLTGFYLLESAFNIPGVGLTLINAIYLQDIYLVQGLIIVFSSLSILAYLIGDLITILLDHRVSLEKDGDNNE